MMDQALPQPPSMLINPQTGMQNKGDATADMFRAENARMQGKTLPGGPIVPNQAFGNYFSKVTGDNGAARSFASGRLNKKLGPMNFGALKPFEPTQSLGFMDGGQLGNGQFQQPALQNFHSDMSWLDELMGTKVI